MSTDIISLRNLAKGQKAIVKSIQAFGEIGKRIRDMGLIVGADIEVVGKAPLNDPVAIRIKGSTLSLRNKEADYILVQVVQPR